MRASKCCFYHHFTGEGSWGMERECNLSQVIQLGSDDRIRSQVVQLRFLGSLEHLRFLGLQLLDSVNEAGCDMMVHNSLRGGEGGFHAYQFIDSANSCWCLLCESPETAQGGHSPGVWSSQRWHCVTFVCEACVISVPGRAGIVSPVGLHGVCPVFVLFNFLACCMAFVKSCYWRESRGVFGGD